MVFPGGEKSLQLQDEKGKTRARIQLDGKGIPKLSLYDEKGNPSFEAPLHAQRLGELESREAEHDAPKRNIR